MRELESNTRLSKGPILALLVAGLVGGGAWEFAEHYDGTRHLDIPEAPVEPADPSPEEVLAPRPTERVLIPPRPVPAPVEEEKDLSAEPTFTPFTTAPDILNRADVVAAMEAEYPKLLKDAGIGGTVRIYFFINAGGDVVKSLIDVSSGHPALDAAAMKVAKVYRFSPAKNRGDPVPVWVSFGITFQVR